VDPRHQRVLGAPEPGGIETFLGDVDDLEPLPAAIKAGKESSLASAERALSIDEDREFGVAHG
jgi:hypothetical protein